jgi:hypothetical protein
LNFSNQKGSKSKYITFPNNLFFDNCDIILNRANRRCIGSALFLRNYVSGKSYKANLRLKNCRFKTKGITKADNAYGIVYYNDASTINKLKITMDNVTFDEGFIAPIGYMRYVKGVFCDTKIVDAKMKGNQILLKQLDAPEKIYTNFGHLQE